MRSVEISQLFADNQERLDLLWLAGRDGGGRILSRDTTAQADVGLVGHMNFIHPFRVQLIGPAEMAYFGTLSPDDQRATFARLLVDELGAVLVCGVGVPADYMVSQCDANHVPLMQCPHPSPHVVDVLRLYLSRMLAANATLHGVFLDVLEMGVLITGASAIGKS